MSSVSNVSNREGDDIVRKNEEEYQKRESQIIRRHNKRVREMSESHTDELDQVKQNYESQIKNLKVKSRENVTLRDQKYERDIKAINKLHNRRMEKITSESDLKFSILRDSAKSDLTRSKRRVTEQVDESRLQKNTALRRQAKNFENFVDDMRKNQDHALKSQRVDLLKHQKKQVKSLQDQRIREIGSLERGLRETRRVSGKQLSDNKESNARTLSRLSKNNMNTILHEREVASITQKDMRAGFKDSLGELRSKQRTKSAEGKKGTLSAFEDFKRETQAKIGKRMDVFEDRISRLTHKNTIKVREAEVQKQRELNNLRKSFANSQKEMESRVNQLKNERNDQTKIDIQKINNKTKEILKTTNRNNRQQINTMSTISREALGTIKETYDTRLKNLSEQQAAGSDRVKVNYQSKEINLRETFNDTVADLKESQIQKIDTVRAKVSKEKSESVQRLKEKVHSEIVKFSRREADLRNKFADKIKGANRQNLKKQKLAEKHNKRIQSELVRNHHDSVDQMKLKYRETLIESNDKHKDEIRRLNRAHNSQMDQLINTLKK